MSLCAECFQRGNHEGHDFNMFRYDDGQMSYLYIYRLGSSEIFLTLDLKLGELVIVGTQV